MIPMEPASLVMEQKTLRGIKQRAERLAANGDDPTILGIADVHSKTAAQVMLRRHVQEGRSAIPKRPIPEA